MRVLFFGNNWVAWQLVAWLRKQGEDFAGLVVHPAGKRRYGREIIRASGLAPSRIFDGSKLTRPEVLKAIKALRPQIGISAFFGYLIPGELLERLPSGCVNVHPAWLPYNRGAYPNVWSIVDGTPAGVSLHYLDERIDTGDVIAQRKVPVDPADTGERLYRRLEHASVKLVADTWPRIRSGRARRTAQRGRGTRHRVADVRRIDEIDLSRRYTARELIDIIRARTFSPYPGAYFRHGGKKVYLRLALLHEHELRNANGY